MSDVAELRELAREARELAAQARGAAAQTRSAQGVDFVSKAADRFKEDLRQDAQRIDAAAAQLDDAARALMDHAQNVEATLAKIRAIEHWFGQRVADAKREVSNAVGAITHTAADILDHAPRAPAPGSPEWLDFARRWRL